MDRNLGMKPASSQVAYYQGDSNFSDLAVDLILNAELVTGQSLLTPFFDLNSNSGPKKHQQFLKNKFPSVGFELSITGFQFATVPQLCFKSKNAFCKHCSVTNCASNVKSTAKSEKIDSPQQSTCPKNLVYTELKKQFISLANIRHTSLVCKATHFVKSWQLMY